MAITVRHDVSGRTAGDVAFETGRGQRRERDIVRAQAAAEEARRVRLAETARREALAQRQSEVEQAREDAEIARLDKLSEAERAREFTAERDVYSRAGRVAELEFGRETGTLAAREAEERRAREFALAAKHKADGDERQYTVEQQRKKDAINSSRVKIDEGVSNGTYTEFQAEQFHQELDKQELGLSKMWGPKQVTPQDELKARTFTADNGTLMYIDGAGKVQPYPGQLTPAEKLEAAEKKETQEYDWEVEREKVEYDQRKDIADLAEKIMSSGEFGMTPQKALQQARALYSIEEAQQDSTPQIQELGETERDELGEVFKTVMKGQPKITVKKFGKDDKRFGAEAYEGALKDAIVRGSHTGLDAATVKAEFDQWWDANYDSERDDRFQKFSSRDTFQEEVDRKRLAELRAKAGQ